MRCLGASSAAPMLHLQGGWNHTSKSPSTSQSECLHGSASTAAAQTHEHHASVCLLSNFPSGPDNPLSTSQGAHIVLHHTRKHPQLRHKCLSSQSRPKPWRQFPLLTPHQTLQKPSAGTLHHCVKSKDVCVLHYLLAQSTFCDNKGCC